jgi:hypothetical protein
MTCGTYLVAPGGRVGSIGYDCLNNQLAVMSAGVEEAEARIKAIQDAAESVLDGVLVSTETDDFFKAVEVIRGK